MENDKEDEEEEAIIEFVLLTNQSIRNGDEKDDVVTWLQTSLVELTQDFLWEASVEPLLCPGNYVERKQRVWSCRVPMGGNTETTWFLIYVARVLTNRESRLAARVFEARDGEVMLIQAAGRLPTWLEPDTAENRVFLYCGDLHIVSPRELEYNDDVVRAAEKLGQGTRADDKLQHAVFKRLKGFPDLAMQNCTHRTRVCVPNFVARIIAVAPRLVPLACLEAERHFDSDRDGVHCDAQDVTMLVRFTRLGYARLVRIGGSSNPEILGRSLTRGFTELLHRARKESSSFVSLNHLFAEMIAVVDNDSIVPMSFDEEIESDSDSWTRDAPIIEEEDDNDDDAWPPTLEGNPTNNDISISSKKFFAALEGLDSYFYEEDLI